MKSVVITALAVLAAVASATEYPSCDQTKLVVVFGGANAVDCDRKFSDVSGAPALAVNVMAATPNYTDAQLNVVCLYSACVAYLTEIKAAEPKDCVYVTGGGNPLLYRDVLNPIEGQCKANGKTPAPNPGKQFPGQKPTTKPPTPPPNQNPGQKPPTKTPSPK